MLDDILRPEYRHNREQGSLQKSWRAYVLGGSRIMRATIIITLLWASLSSDAFAVQPTNSPVGVHWWAVNTPVGTVGYSDCVYSFDAPAADGKHYRDRFVYLGPLGRYRTSLSPVELFALSLLIGVVVSVAGVWLVKRRSLRH